MLKRILTKNTKVSTMVQRYTAFTLAEVLITLGIIGVVAAMTIPTLLQANQKTVVETRLKSFYSNINQAIKLSEIDNGDKKTWDAMPSTGPADVLTWYNKYLKDYLRTVKIDSTTSASSIYVYFADGSSVTIGPSSWIFFPQAKTLDKLISESNVPGYVVTSGKDNFIFFFRPAATGTAYSYHYDRGVEPYKYDWDGTESMLKTDNGIGCKQTVSNARAYCATLIQVNGWKIPDDYPFFN